MNELPCDGLESSSRIDGMERAWSSGEGSKSVSRIDLRVSSSVAAESDSIGGRVGGEDAILIVTTCCQEYTQL